MKILALNGGSSSFKASLFEFADGGEPRPLWDEHLDWNRREGAPTLAQILERVSPGEIDAVGHRIVHGGRAFRETTRITPEVRAALARMAPLDPQHNKLELQGIDEMERLLGPSITQIAVFDTAFHATIPPPAHVYPGPYEWLEQGIRRYGFHGISHQYVSRRAAAVLGRPLESLRIVTCHLGNGCSLAAIREGRSIDTTMGFTPLEGVMMGTRSGSIDPGILIHLARNCGQGPEEIDRILNEQSGLKGVSGISGDMRDVIAAMDQGNERARLAFDVFAHRLCRGIGSMLASLGGLDALVFTGGIGENCWQIRAAAAAAFAFLGVRLEAARNQSPLREDTDISESSSAVRVLGVRTREELEIASEVYRICSQRNPC